LSDAQKTNIRAEITLEQNAAADAATMIFSSLAAVAVAITALAF
jgi:hypothetical protein